MKALLLAAGYATRLYPLTLDKPKPLLPVGPHPIIDYILQNIKRVKAIDEVFVVTNSKFYSHFQAWLEAGDYGLPIEIINDGTFSNDDRLGAIGDIEFVIKKQGIKDDLLVVGADNIFDAELSDFVRFSASKKDSSCVALYDLADRKLATRYGVVSIDAQGKVIDFQEKPSEPKSSFISTCIYYFPSQKLKLFKEYSASQARSNDASGNYIKWLSRTDSVWGYVLKGKWYDIGDMQSYQKANEDFKNR